MKRLSIKAVAVASLALVSLWGCSDYHTGPSWVVPGSGRLVTEVRPVDGFSIVAVSDAARLIVEQTGVESLQITAEDNVLPLLQSEVRNGRLSLGLVPGSDVIPTRQIEYRLTVRRLDGVEASGASRVEFAGVDGEQLAFHLSGASSATASGSLRGLELHLSGASWVQAPDLRSRLVAASLSGVSYGLVRVSGRLDASLSGASTLEYLGAPVVVSSVSGGSVVRRVGP